MITLLAVAALCVAALAYVLWPLRSRRGEARSALEHLEPPARDR